MDKVDIFEYDKRNREDVATAITKANGEMVSWSFFDKDQKTYEFPFGTKQVYIDITSLFRNEDRADPLINVLELTINGIVKQKQTIEILLITEREYSQLTKDLLYFKIGSILSLEEKLQIEDDPIKNIVDLKQEDFASVLEYVENNLFGNKDFKVRLGEELTKFRLFNQIGYQPIFSVLICGASGIGKTEVARLLHKKLSPNGLARLWVSGHLRRVLSRIICDSTLSARPHTRQSMLLRICPARIFASGRWVAKIR